MNTTHTKHTPGPWRSLGQTIAADDPDERARVITIAELLEEDLPWRANARLIAAAPELLDFAIMATQKFERMFPRLAEHGRSLVAKATKGAS